MCSTRTSTSPLQRRVSKEGRRRKRLRATVGEVLLLRRRRLVDMSRVLLCLLLLLRTVFCSDQTNEDDGASFGIVFDTTGSMGSELTQVKNNALSILENALRLPGNPIQDFVFAPFNDPDVPHATLTTSPSEFKGYLERISVDGGGDNPELVYAGLLNALKLARPRLNASQLYGNPNETVNANVKVSSKGFTKRSTIFVFTDDLAKDQHLLPEVLQLIQTKKVLVIFIVSGDTIEPTFKNVTTLSSGQIFQLSKAKVSEIMEYMKQFQKPEEVNMVSVTKTGASEDEYPVVVDKTIEEFTASISGNKAKITVRNPKGNIVTDKAKVIPLIDLEKAKVIKVNKPEPGVWNITSSSTSDHSFRLTGVSKLDFLSGFSAHKAATLNSTFQLPLRGVKNYVSLTSSDIESVRNIQHVEIVFVDGTVLSKLKVKPISRHRGFYRTEAFLPPDKAFYITVVAEGSDGNTIQRTSQTGVVPAPPTADMLKIVDETDSGSILSDHPIMVTTLSFIALYCSRMFDL